MPSSPSPRAVLLVVSGPAGVGKTTLCERMVTSFLGISRFVTTTSRPPRPGEEDGVDYHFLDRAEFERRIAAGAFLEYANVHGNLYGTPRAQVVEALEAGHDLLFNIDVEGAQNYRRAAEQDPVIRERLVTVFIRPVSLDQIRTRLEARGADDAASITRRLQTAERELAVAKSFDHQIVSGTREADFAALQAIYEAAKAGPRAD